MHAALLVFLLCAACGGARGGGGAHGPALRLRMEALDGGEIDTARYLGRVVVLHLFDTASPGSSVDADQLVALQRAEPERVMVIGVSLDPEGRHVVAGWRRAVSATYLIALGGEAVRGGGSPLGAIAVIPTTVVLDQDGRVETRIGRALSYGELARVVQPLLR
jgi:peroxiredoxin